MRILHLTHQYLPHDIGGTELYTQQVATMQAAQGHTVTVLYPAPIDHLSRDMVDGVEIVRYPAGERSRTRVFADSFLNDKPLAELFASLLAESDLVHVQHLMGLSNSLVTQIQVTGLPYIVTLHDYWYLCANAQLIRNNTGEVCTGPDVKWHNCGSCFVARSGVTAGGGVFGRISAPLLRYRHKQLQPILNNATAVIAPTHFVKNIFLQNGYTSDNLTVLPHGLDIPSRLPEPTRQSTLHIAYIGSIAWQKGLHILVAAANQLQDQALEVTIAGGLDTFPEYAAQLQHAAHHPGLSFSGRLSRDAVWALLATVDAVVLPTLWYETSSLILDEAHVMGVPVIASDIGVMPEKIKDGVDGLLFPVGDANALAERIRQLINSAELRQTLATHIPKVQTIESHVSRLHTLYEQAINHSKH